MVLMVLFIVLGIECEPIQHVYRCFAIPQWKMVGQGRPSIDKDALGIFEQVLWQHILP
jgi:hypothetical protein